MRELILKCYNGEQLTMEEAKSILMEYMESIENVNTILLETIFSPTNPFGQDMVNRAITTSVNHLKAKYEINFIQTANEGKFIKAY
jgi:hypothetical protein